MVLKEVVVATARRGWVGGWGGEEGGEGNDGRKLDIDFVWFDLDKVALLSK
jgi:hypothetical protein